MSKIMKKTLTLIALLLVTTTAIAQVPVLKKPVVLAPQAKPAIPPAMLKTPITVVNAAGIASNSPNRDEAARRLKAQNIPVAAALAALRGAFGAGDSEEGRALRAAGYGTPDLLVALKQTDNLDAASMARRMQRIGVPKSEMGPSLRQLYALDFDALLIALRQASTDLEWFGYALDTMDYNVQQMVQAGYRYFNGGFVSPHSGEPYPGPGELYSLLMYEIPLADQIQVNHYALWVMMMNAGYSPVQLFGEIKMATYNHRGAPADAVSVCVAQTNLVNEDRRARIHNDANPALVIRIAPDGSASHSDAQRNCYVQFLDKIRREGGSRAAAAQLAEESVFCLPDTNSGCPTQLTEVAARIVREAGYPGSTN